MLLFGIELPPSSKTIQTIHLRFQTHEDARLVIMAIYNTCDASRISRKICGPWAKKRFADYFVVYYLNIQT